jgi:hypothetical protein
MGIFVRHIVPAFNPAEIAANRKPAAVGRQRRGVNLALLPRSYLPADHTHGFAGLKIPNPHCFVIRCRHELLAAWGEGDVRDLCQMAARIEHELRPDFNGPGLLCKLPLRR